VTVGRPIAAQATALPAAKASVGTTVGLLRASALHFLRCRCAVEAGCGRLQGERWLEKARQFLPDRAVHLNDLVLRGSLAVGHRRVTAYTGHESRPGQQAA
jgi:hypothetical protein